MAVVRGERGVKRGDERGLRARMGGGKECTEITRKTDTQTEESVKCKILLYHQIVSLLG